MRGSVIASVGLHVAVVAFAYFGLPDFNRSLDLPPPPVFVEMVSEEELAALEEDVKPDPTPPEPEPDKTPPPPPPPPPAPEPAPEPEPVQESAPEPEPAPEAEPIPEEIKTPEPPKPEPKPAPKQVAKQPRPSAKPPEPKQKEAPKNDLASVLKTVQKLEDKPKPKPKTEKKPEDKKEDKKEQALADILKKAQQSKTPTQQTTREIRDASELLSSSELDAVTQQISGCWSIQPGARDAENLIVNLRVAMNPDRTVRTVEIIRNNTGNPFQGAAERSAQAAVYKCSPLRLPPNKYDVWNVINFTFDPKQMF